MSSRRSKKKHTEEEEEEEEEVEVEEEEEDNSKQCGRIVFIIDNIVFVLAGIALLLVSIIFLAKFKSFSILFFGTSFAGLLALVVSVLGFCGSQYGKKDKDSKLHFLVGHFSVTFMLCIIIVLFAGFCFFFTDFGKTFLIMTWNNYKNLVNSSSEDGVEKEINKYLENYYYVGGIAVFLFVVIIIGLIFGAYLLGMVKLIKFVLFIGAFSIVVIGVLCVIIGIFFVASYRFAPGSRGMTVAVIIMGGVIILLGVFGMYVGTNFQGKRCFLLIYLVILLLYLVAFVCVGGVFYVLATSTQDSIEENVRKWCTDSKDPGEELAITDAFCLKIKENIEKAYHCTLGGGGGGGGGGEDGNCTLNETDEENCSSSSSSLSSSLTSSSSSSSHSSSVSSSISSTTSSSVLVRVIQKTAHKLEERVYTRKMWLGERKKDGGGGKGERGRGKGEGGEGEKERGGGGGKRDEEREREREEREKIRKERGMLLGGEICKNVSSVLDFLVLFIQEYFRMIGYACFVFGAFIFVNIILVLVCIINPFGAIDEEEDDSEDESPYGKRIEEKDHKSSFTQKPRRVFPSD